MTIREEYSLREHNTLKINATAAWFISYESVEDLERLIRDEYFQECRYLHIGEGSNLLFLTNFHGIILHSEIKTLEVVEETEESISLDVGAGMRWDNLVDYTVAHGYYGLENLSWIPGQVGSAAIQNIGAYGVEISDVIESVLCRHRRTGEVHHFERSACGYGYRTSIFKDADYGDYIVTHVRLRLSKTPKLHIGYKDLTEYFTTRGEAPTLQRVRQAVIEIRQAKLPDPELLGSAGSFFMNPIVPAAKAAELAKAYVDMPSYPQADGSVKLAAAWLIEQCGFKGVRRGDAGVYDRQALILVNHGEATGTDMANLAEEIQSAVRERFGVILTPEVRYIS